jgi:hypothetical protein
LDGIQGSNECSNYNIFCLEVITLKMSKEFKVNDVVEIDGWKGQDKCNWIIQRFSSDNFEATLAQAFTNNTTILPVSRLKHQTALTKAYPKVVLSTMKGFRDHGLSPRPGRGPDFPVSRDWDLEGAIKCRRVGCIVNRTGKCVMPSLVDINAKGVCTGFHQK